MEPRQLRGSESVTTRIEAAFAALSDDPALSGSMGPGAAVVLWNSGIERVLWASPEGAAFGEDFGVPDPSGRERLRALAAELGSSDGARRESITFERSEEPVTLICRAIDLDGDRALATVIVAAGPEERRGATGVEAPEAVPPAGEPAPPDETVTALLERIRRQGVRRFIWSLDRDGRFVSVSHPLAEVVGRAGADIVGRTWEDLSGRLVLDEAGVIADALARRATWSDQTVLWRITDTAYVVPVELGGMPVYGRDHAFEGFRGFGLCRTEEAREAPAAIEPVPASRNEAAETGSIDGQEQRIAFGALQARVGAQFAGARPLAIRAGFDRDRSTIPDTQDTPPHLSVSERGALREIARALGAKLDGDEERAATDRGSAEIVTLPTARAPASDPAFRILDRLPTGILVLRGDTPLYANRFVLDLLGFRDRAELARKGGVTRLFAGRIDRRMKRGSEPTPLVLIARTGDDVTVEVRLSTVEWGDGPASLLLVRPAPEPAETPALRLAEREHARRDERLRDASAIIDLAPLAVTTLDGAGRILSLNRGAERLFGYAQNEVVGESYAVLLAPESHRAAADLLVRASPPSDGIEAELAGRPRSGGTIPLAVTIGRIGEGSATFALVARDLSGTIRAGSETRAAQRAAEIVAGRQSSFLARVSHEIRTPLNAIIGFAEIMLEERFGPVGNERYRAYLRDIHHSGGHVVSLVDDLLDLAKIEAGKWEMSFTSLDLADVVGQSVDLLRGLATQERVILRTALPAGLPRIVADERSIRQIALNLVSNAVRFTSPGGQVIVSAAAADGGGLAVRVRDTGIGMSPAETVAALEPFRQISAAGDRGGTGLGLPLAKALVEANHGLFSLTSSRGSGTLAEILFPPSRVLTD